MKRLSGKLNSRSGASILLAMLFLLLCATIAAITVTAAFGTASRSVHNRESRQNYLAVQSAAELLSRSVQAQGFSAYYSVKETEISTVADDTVDPPVMEYETVYEYACGSHGLDSEDLLEFGTELYSRYKATIPDHVRSKIPSLSFATDDYTASTVISAEGMPNVLLSYRLTGSGYKRYALSCTLSCEDGSNAISIKFAPVESSEVKVTNPSSNVTLTTTTTRVSWAAPVITRGGPPA